jgi:hypothetical protein
MRRTLESDPIVKQVIVLSSCISERYMKILGTCSLFINVNQALLEIVIFFFYSSQAKFMEFRSNFRF